MSRPAVFFDRDNTLIANDGYLGNPSGVVLIGGAADAVARVRALGYAAVVFSNQSGVARGMFPEEAVHAVNQRLDEMLLDHNPGAIIDRHEFCPFHPEASVEHYRQDSELRKPKPGMLLQAADALGLELGRSWVVGDAPRDIAAGRAAGCRTILFRGPNLPPSPAASEPADDAAPDFTVESLSEAAEVIAAYTPAPESADASASGGHPTPADGGVPNGTAPAGERPAAAPLAPELVEESPQTVEAAQRAPAAIAEEERPEPPAAPPPLSVSEPPEAAAEPPARPPTMPAPTIPVPAATAPQRSPTVEAENATAAPVSSAAPVGERAVPVVSTARLEKLAHRILEEMQRHREQPQGDFSVSKLLAGIVQILALATLFLAYLNRAYAQEILLVAIFLQTFTIALLIMGKQR